MSPIERLSPEQLGGAETVREAWLDIALATGPADRQAAEAGVAQAYRAAGLRQPEFVVWELSPKAGIEKARTLERQWFRPQVLETGWGAGRVDAKLRERVRKRLSHPLAELFRKEVDEALTDQFDRDDLHSPDDPYAWQEAADAFSYWAGLNARRGDLDLAEYDFFARNDIVDAAHGPAARIRIAKSTGWWWPFRNHVILTERPVAASFDEQGRLHNEDAPAVSYPDGWGIWAWHGVRVPKKVIEPGWSDRDIAREPDSRIRRAALERLGRAPQVTGLSSDHTAGALAVRKEWVASAKSTRPANRDEAEAGVAHVYRAVGVDPPTTFTWVGSPYAGAVAAWRLGKDTRHRSVLDQPWRQVDDRCAAQFDGRLRKRINQYLEHWSQWLGDLIRDQVRQDVHGVPVMSFGEWFEDPSYWAGFGQFDASRLAGLDFFTRYCFFEAGDWCAAMIRIAKSAGWWWPLGDTVILSERPVSLSFDEQGRLHGEDEPAVSYPDGWGVRARHGTRVPQAVPTAAGVDSIPTLVDHDCADGQTPSEFAFAVLADGRTIMARYSQDDWTLTLDGCEFEVVPAQTGDTNWVPLSGEWARAPETPLPAISTADVHIARFRYLFMHHHGYLSGPVVIVFDLSTMTATVSKALTIDGVG